MDLKKARKLLKLNKNFNEYSKNDVYDNFWTEKVEAQSKYFSQDMNIALKIARVYIDALHTVLPYINTKVNTKGTILNKVIPNSRVISKSNDQLNENIGDRVIDYFKNSRTKDDYECFYNILSDTSESKRYNISNFLNQLKLKMKNVAGLEKYKPIFMKYIDACNAAEEFNLIVPFV